MRRTIVDIRRRIAAINEKLPNKFKLESGRCEGGFIIESNRGSKTEQYHRSINEMDIFLDGYDRGIDAMEFLNKENAAVAASNYFIGYICSGCGLEGNLYAHTDNNGKCPVCGGKLVAKNPLHKPLYDLVRLFLDGRNYNTQNPYTRPEIKEALQALKEATGFSGDWRDAAPPPLMKIKLDRLKPTNL
jgi:ribosomal protein S27E